MQRIVLKLGTAIKIQTILDQNTPDSVKITIEDSSNNLKVNQANMTSVATNIYQYIWQSSLSTDQEGDYYVTIKATYGSYTSAEESVFTLEKLLTDK